MYPSTPVEVGLTRFSALASALVMKKLSPTRPASAPVALAAIRPPCTRAASCEARAACMVAWLVR